MLHIVVAIVRFSFWISIALLLTALMLPILILALTARGGGAFFRPIGHAFRASVGSV